MASSRAEPRETVWRGVESVSSLALVTHTAQTGSSID